MSYGWHGNTTYHTAGAIPYGMVVVMLGTAVVHLFSLRIRDQPAEKSAFILTHRRLGLPLPINHPSVDTPTRHSLEYHHTSNAV